MNQRSRRILLIRMLTEERGLGEPVPEDDAGQRRMLRRLLNTRPAVPADTELLELQDEYLSEAVRSRGIVDPSDLAHFGDRIVLWKGDITRLDVDAVVDAANGRLTGCWDPNHACVDNCIHTYAGMELRIECARLMREQRRSEPVGSAVVTPAFNLPCRYVIHTVGPIVKGTVTDGDRVALCSCYRSCLEAAEIRGFDTVAFCCISAGTFGFPGDEAAEIAVGTVSDFLSEHGLPSTVVFDVFLDSDEAAYLEVLERRGLRRTG